MGLISRTRKEIAGKRVQGALHDDASADRDKEAVDGYFEHIDEAAAHRKAGRTDEALAAALRGVDLLPALVRSEAREFGDFKIKSLPPVHEACVLASIRCDPQALAHVRSILSAVPELHRWLEDVDAAAEDLGLVESLLNHVHAHPGALQSSLSHNLGVDGARISRLIRYLVQGFQLRREPDGKTYRLFLAQS